MFQSKKSNDLIISISNGKIAARNWPGDNPYPIIALHGWLDNLESFSPLIEQGFLLENGWDITCIDFLGHGNSSKKATAENYHFLDAVTEVIDFVNTIDVQEFIIVGHSMGAAVGALIAAAFPERVKALMTIEALGPLSQQNTGAAEQLRKHIKKRLQPESNLRRYLSIEEAIQDRQQWHKNKNVNLYSMISRNLQKTEQGYIWKTDKRLRWPSPSPMSESQIEEILQAINCPVLYVEAEQGYTFVHQLALQRSRFVKDLTQIKMVGDHHCHMDDVEFLSHQIQHFLDEKL